ncbi:MAG: hypothetical protein Alpg2KO_06410 [Alphaproteobacteria bacterium]
MLDDIIMKTAKLPANKIRRMGRHILPIQRAAPPAYVSMPDEPLKKRRVREGVERTEVIRYMSK